MRNGSCKPLALIRRHARPSLLARVLWLLIAGLHGWLIVRRVALGQWTDPLDFLRCGLCLAGVGYASLKFWRMATIFDSAPRRALVFALILILGHWVIASPSRQGDLFGRAATMPVTMILAVAPALGAAFLLLKVYSQPARTLAGERRRPDLPFIQSFELAHLPLAVARRSPTIFRRPPPFSA